MILCSYVLQIQGQHCRKGKQAYLNPYICNRTVSDNRYSTMQKIKRKKKKILGDSSRVIARLHIPGDPHRIPKIIKRIVDLSDVTAENLLEQIMLDFSERHRDIKRVFELHMNSVSDYVPRSTVLSETKRVLIGAYFTMEYSIESAALFNPSISPHPDQSHLDTGSLRFIMSFRAVGEGHISSLVFRGGCLDQDNTIIFDPISEYVETPDLHVDPIYDRHLFQLKLKEMDACNEITAYLLDLLPESFAYNELKERIGALASRPVVPDARQNETFEVMHWLSNSNYEMSFRDSGTERFAMIRVTDDEARERNVCWDWPACAASIRRSM